MTDVSRAPVSGNRDLLGRGVLLAPGDQVPQLWARSEQVLLDESALSAPADVVSRLHQAWATRRPVVVRLAVDPGRFRQPRSYPGEPWRRPADFECFEDRLHFLVWANNYDGQKDPSAPTWWWGRKATRLGATPLPPGSAGDVALPDGRPAWIDGGPRSPFRSQDLGGAVVVHADSIERGQLRVAPEPVVARADLAPDQLAAVSHQSGPARVIAPAGSGKTRVLTERLRHLLEDRRWEPDAVLAVAYNKKAQEELDARCQGTGARTRTLNSLGLWVLSQAAGRSPAVLEERDTRRIVEQLAPIRRRRANTDPIGPYVEALGQVRLGLRDPAEVESWRDDVPGLADLFPKYRAQLKASGAVDFDEQIYGAVEALLTDGALRVNAQRSCRHLLVDEFQDLTPAHVLMLRLLSSPGFDVFGVGDDDQVIYGHAGADPRFLIDFARLWPGAALHPLEVNYRCPAPVVTAAATLLSYNDRRVAKEIRAARAPSEGTPELEVRTHPGAEGAATLAAAIEGWHDDGVGYESTAVLARVNSMLLAPHVALAAAGVPIASVLRPDILERTGLRAALAWLRIAVAADGEIAAGDVIEVLRRPSRGLPQWFPDRLRRRSRWSASNLFALAGQVPDKEGAKVEDLVDDIVALRAAARSPDVTTGRLLEHIRDSIGLAKAMTLLDSSRGGEGSSHLDDLEALEQVAGLQPDPAQFEPWLRERFERATDPGGVTLSTVHRVKGMEWDRVVLYGATGGLMPHRLADDEEEERRVMHVGITRGRERVLVLGDRSRPSPFLTELTGRAPYVSPSARPTAFVPAAGRTGKKGPGAAPTAPTAPGDRALEEALRSWRKERSTADGVPAYVVFADKTLKGIVTARPSSLVALRQVEGIGPTKLELYGEDILAVVGAHHTSEESVSQPSGGAG